MSADGNSNSSSSHNNSRATAFASFLEKKIQLFGSLFFFLIKKH
jgi:hypothetical protein